MQLVNYGWPGNVREVRNLVQRLAVTCPSNTIRPAHLKGVLTPSGVAQDRLSLPLGSSLEETEAALIRQTLERVTSNRREAAAVLGISVRSLQYKIKRYGIGAR